MHRHAEPEQAAQVLGNLAANRRPSPNNPSSPLNPPSYRPNSPAGRRPSPNSAQQQYKPTQPQPLRTEYRHNSEGSHSYHATPTNNAAPSLNYNERYNQQAPPSNARFQSPPPPTGYGQGPPPPNPTSRLPQLAHNRLPPSPAPPPDADSPDLYKLFLAANTSRSGTLSESELGSALVNADYTAFDAYTIKMMMRMFSSAPRQDFVTYDEFVDLWRFLAAWRELFERFDEDRSGHISLAEFSKALVAFGYRLTSSFTNMLYNIYNEKGILASQRRGSRTTKEAMSFDLFVQACISLKRMTDVFKGYDEDRDGYVTLSFEEFLTEILRLRE
jgi:Ca2+-binding EF-hand superfamily protein